MADSNKSQLPDPDSFPATRGYQQEMLEESLAKNLIIALDTGSGKTHIAILRMKIEVEREAKKITWFFSPTVLLCSQQKRVISDALPVSVGLISGALEPGQWIDPALWRGVLEKHRVMVTTPQVLLDALRHGYVNLGTDISLLVFDEAHHAVDNHPYNCIMKEFYYSLPSRIPGFQGSCRPAILGLTASPIYGGHVDSAFRTIEANLDSVIRTPMRHLDELATFVHRPVFKHIQYIAPESDYMISPSYNVAALEIVIARMQIENDPYVKSLRAQLARIPPGSPDYFRVDQKLSKAVSGESTYTHKGLKDLARAAAEICSDVGPWAADWYVAKVLKQAQEAESPYKNYISVRQDSEKAYLLKILASVKTIPVSYDPEHIIAGISDKTRVLAECLDNERRFAESDGEIYSGIVFVTRRDTVLALAEVLEHHPLTAKTFQIGCLLGSSDHPYRQSFLDITRKMLLQTQEEVLLDFKVGSKNLIVSTAVAEEGIDIQACGNVVRWDIPVNMASWAQSRGRARRQKSTFVLMFDDHRVHHDLVEKWERIEKEMQASYNNTRPRLRDEADGSDYIESQDTEYRDFSVESTGALLTLDSAVSHLNHFCSVIPSTSHHAYIPIYDIDPPDLPEGWHSMEYRGKPQPYQGPWGARVTLPKLLPKDLRVFSTDRVHTTKRSAYNNVAFDAYLALYNAGLLNQHLLPLTSVVEPELDEEVKALLKEIEKRDGTATVSAQFNPWAPINDLDEWWCAELAVDGLPPLRLLARNRLCDIPDDELPVLFHPHRSPLKVRICSLQSVDISIQMITEAQLYTRRLFWQVYGTRMKWDDLNFAYLFQPAPSEDNDTIWDARRAWHSDRSENQMSGKPDILRANAKFFGETFSYPTDLTIIRERGSEGRLYRFLRWKFDPASLEEEQEIRVRGRGEPLPEDEVIEPPFIVVQNFPRRMNFLIPFAPQQGRYSMEIDILLRPLFSTIDLVPSTDTDYAILLPSIMRYLSIAMTVSSLRAELLTSNLAQIPFDLLRTAITAPVAQDIVDYQRLETLGDTVLKFIVTMQLLAQFPLWHEGYLAMKKDHIVSNVKLAKEAHSKRLYYWIIRDRFSAQKWKPLYIPAPTDEVQAEPQQLSTKMLADVVESLIGASYLHGGFDLAIECAQLFGKGLNWESLPVRVNTMLATVEETDEFLLQTADVEKLLGYTFSRKLLLMEALTHASYHLDTQTVSYERMEFLGDSVLDMIITDFLYHAPGKKYSPGHIHLRKSAVVNTHFLAYICLRTHIDVGSSMPRPDGEGNIIVQPESQPVYLWQCMLHSSPRLLDDFSNTFARYKKYRDEIENFMAKDSIFPWAALTRLQAPKPLSDMIESLLGAIYIDSGGSFDTVQAVLRKLGILDIIERIVSEDVDILHPVSRLGVWASKQGKKIEYEYEKVDDQVTCIVKLDGEEEHRFSDVYRGVASQNDAKFAAAEMVIRKLKLREQDGKTNEVAGDEDEGQ